MNGKTSFSAGRIITGTLFTLEATASSASALNYYIQGSWDTETRRNAAISAMNLATSRFNNYAMFSKSLNVYYNSGVATADGSFGGTIRFGGTWPAERVALHETGHTLGVGTYSSWDGLMSGGTWDGVKARAQLAQFDGVGAVVHGDTNHFWPYGLNQDSENSEINRQRFVAMVYAFRADMGINTAGSIPSTATNVSLQADDPTGTSAFNYAAGWSDNHFSHYGADYSIGNFVIRTPASSASFNFYGNSLRINNTSIAGKGLYFKGTGTTAQITFSDLILDGGTVHHYSGAGDVFNLAGKVTVASASTIYSEQGSTNVKASVTGNAPLTIGALNGNTVRFTSSNNSFTGNLNIVGRFELADNANHVFVVGDSGVNNSITGATAASVLLNGDFQIDLSNAELSTTAYWTLVSAANVVYGSTFNVSGFTENSGVWSNSAGFRFAESDGRLTYIGGAALVSVPEPTSLACFGVCSIILSSRRHRSHR